jgi:hypothetical protein
VGKRFEQAVRSDRLLGRCVTPQVPSFSVISVISVNQPCNILIVDGDRLLTTQILQFKKLQDQDRKQIGFVPGEGGQVELRLRTGSETTETMALPREVSELIEVLLDHLARGAEVAILTEDQELSPNDVARVLGVSRPLVVYRMEIGDLPFRYVGKHRRAKLRDVLALKSKIDIQRAALDALAEDTEELMRKNAV